MFHPKAPLGYTGGKSRLRRQILPYFPRTANAYVEPFLGGGSVFVSAWWNLYRNIPCTISDINEDLMTFYKVVRSSPDELIELIQGELDHWQGNYREMIKYLDTKSAYISRAAKVYLYSRLNFGSLQFPHSFSQSKVTELDTMVDVTHDRIKRLATILGSPNVTMRHACALDIIAQTPPNSFIYMDPSYPGAEDVYQTETFDHVALFNLLRDIHFPTDWLLSYRDDAFIRGLYDDYYIAELNHTYHFKPDHKPTPPRPVTELLISNFPINTPFTQLPLNI